MSSEANDVFRIDSMTLRNFRCFEERTIEFSPQFNVLVGDNGTGKTAVLDALYAGVGPVAPLIVSGQDPEPSIDESDVRRLCFPSEGLHNVEMQWPASIAMTGILQHRAVDWLLERHPGGHGGNRTRLFEPCGALRQAVSDGQRVPLPLIAWFQAERAWHHEKRGPSDVELFEQRSRLEGYKGWWAATGETKSLIAWFVTMEFASFQKRSELPTLSAVKEAMIQAVPDCDSVAYDTQQGQLLFGFGEGRTLPFNMLSHGVRNMLAIVADMAWRCAVLNPHLGGQAARQTPGVVLIDELDLHLHPSWQRRVVGDLHRAFPKLQFIVATHSPFIIQSLDSVEQGRLIQLDDRPIEEDFRGKSIEDIVEDVQGVDLPQMSERRQKMLEAAQEYYRILEQAKHADPGETERLKQRLDQLVMPFSDDVAYHAFLQMERLAAGLGDDDQ